MMPPRIGQLTALHPFVARKAKSAFDAAEKAGLSVGPYETVRTDARQAALYAQGRTAPGAIVTNAKAGNGWHLYGLAFDAVFIDGAVWTWKGDYNTLGKIFESFGFEWARRWKSFPEDAHFQMTFGLSLSEARTLLDKGGTSAVWAKIDAIISSKGLS